MNPPKQKDINFWSGGSNEAQQPCNRSGGDFETDFKKLEISFLFRALNYKKRTKSDAVRLFNPHANIEIEI
jgi:hypothetical protein